MTKSLIFTVLVIDINLNQVPPPSKWCVKHGCTDLDGDSVYWLPLHACIEVNSKIGLQCTKTERPKHEVTSTT